MRDIHEDTCGKNYRVQSLTQKALCQGYYWFIMWKDAKNMVRSYDKYQRFAKLPHQTLEKLTVMPSSWPFAIWGMDLISLL